MTDSDDLADAITLREAADAGMFPSLDAARKAVHRAHLTPAGHQYASALYSLEALATCQPGKVRLAPGRERLPATTPEHRPCLLQDDGEVRTIPGYAGYEACDRGHINSRDRTNTDGRFYKGKALAPRQSNRGYQLVNVRTDAGKWETRTVHSLILLAHKGAPPHGQVTRHLNDDPDDNRYPENLAYGTPEENEQDKFANGTRKAAAPKPERHCVRCNAVLEPGRGGKRCHPCVVDIAEEGAKLLAADVPLDEVCKRLEYPSETGLLTLAKRYGNLRLVIGPVSWGPGEGKSRGATATLRHILRKRGGHVR